MQVRLLKVNELIQCDCVVLDRFVLERTTIHQENVFATVDTAYFHSFHRLHRYSSELSR